MHSSDKAKSSEIVEHLFRREAGRITSVLARIFGMENIELAEDVVQDTLLKAFSNGLTAAYLIILLHGSSEAPRIKQLIY